MGRRPMSAAGYLLDTASPGEIIATPADGRPECGVESPSGWFCSRTDTGHTTGHRGQHVAWASGGAVRATWPGVPAADRLDAFGGWLVELRDACTCGGGTPEASAGERVADSPREGPERGVTNEAVDVIDGYARAAANELRRAVATHPGMNSAHEGYAVILEELDELWDEVRNDKAPGARTRQRAEAVQVAAMALRFLVDLNAEPTDPFLAHVPGSTDR